MITWPLSRERKEDQKPLARNYAMSKARNLIVSLQSGRKEN
ncbi:hypothetical protein SD77_2919 [Bacillus badius]|uniref:Uncharacterized protein n=1 Tax=Bacillus badius TaxID=1455 RepID=A0ABR5APB0_BACBA|nr:hypothetical protein SD77_2919 [Bacillus badius]